MTDIISKINTKLEKLPKYHPTSQELVQECYATISTKLSQGWTFERLSKIISDEGFTISASSLKLYYNKILKSIEVTKKLENSNNEINELNSNSQKSKQPIIDNLK